MSTQQRERVEISWVQVFGSALAAVTSAVLLSTVGVAGTIIGAAIGSVFATAGSAIYAHYLRMTRAGVAAAQAAAAERVNRARTGASGVWADTRRADGSRTTTMRAQQARAELEDAERDLDEAPERARPSWREAAAGLPWKRIAALAGGVFLVAMLVIVSFELATGRPVSQYTGGTSDHGPRTSIPGLGGGRGASTTPTPAPTGTPTTGASTGAPTAGASSTTTPTTGPTAGPTAGPSTTPSTAPTTAAPTAAPTSGAPRGTPTATSTPTPGQTPTG
jgi:hypothetical protein